MHARTQEEKELFQTTPKAHHAAIRFLLNSQTLSFAEVKKVARQSPGIYHAHEIFPVRLTVPSYPETACTFGMFYAVQEFILEAVHREGAPFLLDLLLMAGYILVLTQSDVSADFVCNLVPEMVKEGIFLKEPTRAEIKEYYAKIFERNKKKNLSRK